jgi:hypothetical protein
VRSVFREKAIDTCDNVLYHTPKKQKRLKCFTVLGFLRAIAVLPELPGCRL